MIGSVTAAVLQGTRVSSSDASESGSGAGTGTGMGTGTDVSNEDGDNVGRTCRQGRTASNGRVEQRDGQRQTDVSDRDTDSVRRTCPTERWTASDGRVGQGRTTSDGRVGQGWAALDERRRDGGTEEMEETEETETRLIFRIEYKRLHEEKKKTKHGRQPSLYTQFSQLPYIPLLIPAQLTYVLILTYVFITTQLIQPSLMQPGPRTDTLSKIEISGAR